MCVCLCVHAFVCVLSHIGLKAISSQLEEITFILY